MGQSKPAPHPHCPGCGYNLTGIPLPRCPECGLALLPHEWASVQAGRAVAPRLAWEHRGGRSWPRAFLSTTAAMLLRPGRYALGLRTDDRPERALLYLLFLVPFATVTCLALSFGMAYGWEWLLSRFWPNPLRQYTYLPFTFGSFWFGAKRVFAASFFFIGIGGCAWLPALIAWDAALWRDRRTFRILLKTLAYTFVWHVFVVAPAAGPVRMILMNRLPSLTWGYQARGGLLEGVWPWPAWTLAGLFTLQAILLLRVLRSRAGAITPEARPGRRRALVILGIGYAAGMYLLLFDLVVHLRFYLQFYWEVAWPWLIPSS